MVISNREVGECGMARKRITQIFPFLIPFRTWQRNLCYQLHMHFDKNIYAKKRGDLLTNIVVCEKTKMINEESGYALVYQKNKVDNLKILSKTMNQVYIYPNEIFSFCFLAQQSKKYGKYKKGLILIDGKIVARKGGGICHLSNTLYYAFLKTPLTIVERHAHKVKSLPNPDKDALEGVDATISSGWLDLKVQNNTANTYQISITFDEENMYVCILSSEEAREEAFISNRNFKYIRKRGKIFESVEVVRTIRDKKTKKELKQEKLYDEIVEVNYPLAQDIEIEEL